MIIRVIHELKYYIIRYNTDVRFVGSKMYGNILVQWILVEYQR